MRDGPTSTESAGNVFADLSLPDAEIRLAMADLVFLLSTFIRERGLAQREAAALLGIDHPKVSAITRGRLTDFSLERLLTLVNRLGMDIEIVVRPNEALGQPGRMVVRTDDALLASRASQ